MTEKEPDKPKYDYLKAPTLILLFFSLFLISVGIWFIIKGESAIGVSRGRYSSSNGTLQQLNGPVVIFLGAIMGAFPFLQLIDYIKSKRKD